jgi:hypothetical protein
MTQPAGMHFLARIAELLAVPSLDKLARYRSMVVTLAERSFRNLPRVRSGQQECAPEMCQPSQKRIDLKNPQDFENS